MLILSLYSVLPLTTPGCKASRIELLLEDDAERLNLIPRYDILKREKLISKIERHKVVFDLTKEEMHDCIKVKSCLSVCLYFAV